MNLMDLFGKVASSIENLTSLTEVKEAANRVISDINAKWPGELQTDQITRLFSNTKESCTFSQSGDNDTIVTTTNLQGKGLTANGIIYVEGSTYANNNGPFAVDSVITQTVTLDVNDVVQGTTQDVTISAFTLINALYPDTSSKAGKDYTINSRLNQITIDSKMKELLALFNNNVELERRDREYVLDTNNKSEYCYAMVGRSTLVLPESVFSNEEDVLTIKMLKKIPAISLVVTTATIEIPLALEELLFSGVMVCLLAKPQYADESLSKLHSALYATDLAALTTQEYDRFENSSRELNYKY